MLTYAITVVDDLELAEEIVQDVFVIAWNKYEDLMLSQNPGGWLMNTTKFTIRNTLRKIKANGPTPLPLDDTICLIDRTKTLSLILVATSSSVLLPNMSPHGICSFCKKSLWKDIPASMWQKC